jgi:hypothetical protein
MELWTQLRPRARWGMKIEGVRIAFSAERGLFRSAAAWLLESPIAGHLPGVKHSLPKLL